MQVFLCFLLNTISKKGQNNVVAQKNRNWRNKKWLTIIQKTQQTIRQITQTTTTQIQTTVTQTTLQTNHQILIIMIIRTSHQTSQTTIHRISSLQIVDS